MCLRAIEIGFDSIGFSRHARTPNSLDFTMAETGVEEYKAEANRLKSVYGDRLAIFCGTEFDLYSVDKIEGYDYSIGSLHYFRENGELIAFDRAPKKVQKMVEEHFGGNGRAFAKKYYEDVVKLAEYKPDIIGHFDIVTKHAKTLSLFDEESKEYQGWAIEALRELAKTVNVFELNTGCVPRGYRDTPYLAPFMVKELKRLGCQITISSDCHKKEFFDSEWDTAKARLLDCGYKNIVILTKDGFKEEAII